MCCLAVPEPKQEDIRKRAHEIYQRRSMRGIFDTDFNDWIQARANLLKEWEQEFKENWKRGECGS